SFSSAGRSIMFEPRSLSPKANGTTVRQESARARHNAHTGATSQDACECPCGSCVLPERLSDVDWPRMSRTATLNIGTYLTRSAEQVPDRLAVAYGESRATYAEEELRVNALALALKSLGLEKRDRVAILQWNCRQFLETMFACFKAGFCVVPI